MDTVEELFESELKDIYSAEKQLSKALPKMAKYATTDALKQAFNLHLEQTKVQITRLEEIGQMKGFKLTGKVCAAMKGLCEEGQEILDEEDKSEVTDLALIGAAQRIEHYEMAAYGTALALAKALKYVDVMPHLKATLQEEKDTDKILTGVAEKQVMPDALMAGGGAEEEVDEEVEVDDEE